MLSRLKASMTLLSLLNRTPEVSDLNTTETEEDINKLQELLNERSDEEDK